MKEVRNNLSLKEINKIPQRNTTIYSSLSGKIFCFYQLPQGSAGHSTSLRYIIYPLRGKIDKKINFK